MPGQRMHLHLFGAATSSGEALRRQAAAAVPDWPLYAYSRRPSQPALDPAAPVAYAAEFNDPAAFHPAGDAAAPACWLSFGPIWLLAPFLEQLCRHHPERLGGLRGLVACSSSSALTKRFAANRFDRELVARLIGAEHSLLATCGQLGVPCRILRPSLIYGQVGPYGDRNLSRLLRLMGRLPVLPLPAQTGLRQPIHASQLAAVALHLARQLSSGESDAASPEAIAIGGDTILSYAAMLQALQQAQPLGHPARRCRLLPLPNRLFFLLAVPLLLRSPKGFEAVLRMAADLSGFTPSHQLLEKPPQPFPVLPLA